MEAASDRNKQQNFEWASAFMFVVISGGVSCDILVKQGQTPQSEERHNKQEVHHNF